MNEESINVQFQHKKTAKKLQDLMVQAENEANKAVGGNEMVNDWYLNRTFVFFIIILA